VAVFLSCGRKSWHKGGFYTYPYIVTTMLGKALYCKAIHKLHLSRQLHRGLPGTHFFADVIHSAF